MNKKTIIALVVVIVLLLAWWFVMPKRSVTPSGTTAVKGESETVYEQALNGLDDAGLDGEMQTLDTGINKL